MTVSDDALAMLTNEPRRASSYRADPRTQPLRSWRSLLGGAFGKHPHKDRVQGD